MAVRITSLLLTVLYATGLVLSAPTAKDASSPLSSIITKPSQAHTTTTTAERIAAARDKTKRARLFRVDRALWSKLPKTDQPTRYFLDATLELLETSQAAEGVPVFAAASDKDSDKSVIVDTNGDLMAAYGHDKFVPVWGRERKHHHHHHHHGAHHSRALGQRFALFILGFSLALAVICSCMRG